jgi:uncharacterized membrane protein
MKHKDIIHLDENRKFQLERVSLFSDAVIAIAITLLIIELHFPKPETGTIQEFWNNTLHILPQFIGFLVSFLLIGLYWTIHHKIFEFVKEFDNKLLWLNIFFLLSIVIMPFSTKIAFEHFTFPNYPWIFYCLNHILIGICILRLWNYLDKNPKKTTGLENKRILKYKKWRSIGTILVFAFSIIVAFFHPFYAMYCPILILPSIFLVKRKFKDVVKNINLA